MVRFPFRIFFICILIASYAGLASTAVAQQDSTAHQLRVVEIFGKPAEVYAVGSHVTQLDSTYLSTYSSSTLADALQARTPLYFKSYGASGISSVAFRGTNASQTAVLWNGLNIAPATLGQTDFSTLPVTGFGEVAVQYGAAATNYGSGAIGGAILLSSPDYDDHKGLEADIKLEAGSFGRYFGNGSVRYSGKKLSYGLSAYSLWVENDYKFKDLSRFGKPEVRQEHASVEQRGLTQDIGWAITPKTKLALHGWYTFSDRHLQPAMGSVYANEKQRDESRRLMATLQHESWLGKTDIKLAYFNDFLHYTDRNNDSESDVDAYQLQAEQTYAYGRHWSLRGGLNLQHYQAKNDGYAGEQDESRASVFALFRYDPLEHLQLSLNLRQAFAENYNPPLTPSFGFTYKPLQNDLLAIKGSLSGSYRLPTLNDRFWLGAGNPELRPEQGKNTELGLLHKTVLNQTELTLEATAYLMQVDNWIQWAPNERGTWRPTNLQKVENKGVELSASAKRKLGQLSLQANAGYTYTSSEQQKVYEGSGNDVGKQLMYVPLHKGVFSAEARYQAWSLLGNLNYTGLRYTSNSETNSLDSFLLLNLALTRKIKLQQNTLLLTLRTDNVTDEVYQTMLNRAMPPRGYTFSLRFIIP
ncbi:iron complex outermembrane receptor protein [Pontibacter ummariensis]|uniref:Iron complex outermembrane recepter protein n=1 Tax=Pontibacter ummariensis TaxID=1610492 RepID=A0A239HB66_9BACT|nr:TonB-dependent receptor [Pontibacter ummariensis]PRY10716.1 iron complex outermembrane receptor protein [Pontibacter ummariensis]SNS77494.1 iron complex outermembrane recepter protein [Pontibacter ummariensis]